MNELSDFTIDQLKIWAEKHTSKIENMKEINREELTLIQKVVAENMELNEEVKRLRAALYPMQIENERLKVLIENQFFLRRQGSGNRDRVINESWQQFKTENNL